MSRLIKIDEEYAEWIQSVGARFKFYDSLSKDLVSAMPDQKSFSPRNLRYMTQFYQMYNEILPQAVAQMDDRESGKSVFLCKKDH